MKATSIRDQGTAGCVKIAHYMARFRLEDGGVVRAVLDFCSLMAHRGREVTIFTWDDKDIPEDWKNGEPGTPKVVRLPPPDLPGGLYRKKALDAVVSRFSDLDVLHLHTPWDRVNLQLSKAARRHQLPYVVTIHGMLDDWCMDQKGIKKRLYLSLGARSMLEHAAAVHCTAQAELTQSRRWFPNGNGVVIPLIFDLGPYRELPGPETAREAFEAAWTDDPILLFLSRIHVKKRVDLVIQAAAQLRDEGVPFRLLIAGVAEEGDEYEEQCRQQADKLGLSGVVTFLGHVEGIEKVSLFQAADLFVLPTSQENFGFVLVEALACETPAITTRGCDIWPELESCGGAVIAEQTVEGFVRGIRELLADPARCEGMGQAGRSWVLEALDANAIATQFETMYNAACGTIPR